MLLLVGCIRVGPAIGPLVETSGDIPVTIHRPPLWCGGALAVRINLNGERVADVSNGETVVIAVPEGSHQFSATCKKGDYGFYKWHTNAPVAFQVNGPLDLEVEHCHCIIESPDWMSGHRDRMH